MIGIGFTFNKTNIFSRLIAWFTKSKWSHCFVIIGTLEDDSIILESSFHGGVKFNLLSRYQTDQYNLEIIDIGQAKLSSALPLIGSNYGSSQIFGYFISKLFGLKNNPITKDTVCSEVVWMILNDSKYSTAISKFDPQLVSPQDLYEVLKNG